jgi:hypothetical protein
LLGVTDEELFSRKLGEKKYRSYLEAKRACKSSWDRRKLRASIWLDISPRTLYRHEDRIWPSFLEALEQYLASGQLGTSELAGQEGAGIEVPERLRSWRREARLYECEVISGRLLHLQDSLTRAVHKIREGLTGTDAVLFGSHILPMVHASFQRFHTKLYQLVLIHHSLLIIDDSRFGDQVADCIWTIYECVPLELTAKDEWLHNLLSRPQSRDVFQALQTAHAMVTVGAADQTKEQWQEFLLNCQCQDDEHTNTQCPVHTLIKASSAGYRMLEKLRLSL